MAIGEGTVTYTNESASIVRVKGGVVTYAPMVRKGHTFYLDNKWHHIVCVIGSNFNKIYIDGVEEAVTYLAGSATSTGFMDVNNIDVMYIGRRELTGFASHYSKGGIADVRVYSDALTADEVTYIYTAGRLGTDPGTANLVGQWKLDDLYGTNVKDYAGVNDGTATNITESTFWAQG
jgi:hypothetical protein